MKACTPVEVHVSDQHISVEARQRLTHDVHFLTRWCNIKAKVRKVEEVKV